MWALRDTLGLHITILIRATGKSRRWRRRDKGGCPALQRGEHPSKSAGARLWGRRGSRATRRGAAIVVGHCHDRYFVVGVVMRGELQ